MPCTTARSILRLPRAAGIRLAWLALALVLAAAVLAAVPAPASLQAPEQVADGVQLFRVTDPELLTPPGPISVQALRLDPKRVELRTALAGERLPMKATVEEIARRDGALAAINAGFFVVASGRAAGFLKVDGLLISPSARPRGAVGILGRTWRRPMRLVFDQLAVGAPTAGQPRGRYAPRLGTSARDWASARHAVGGAGLLVKQGRNMTPDDWKREELAPGFTSMRHPRTVIGIDEAGAIWLVAVDGRNPLSSLGMDFGELQNLARRLALRDALNLDGGGSTTLVVRGEVVNRPSDPAGPRPVTDAILVFPRRARPR